MKLEKNLKLMEFLNNEKIINCIKIINTTHKQFVYVVDKKKN